MALELGAHVRSRDVQRPQGGVARLAELLARTKLLLLKATLPLFVLEVHARLLEPPLALGGELILLPLGHLHEERCGQFELGLGSRLLRRHSHTHLCRTRRG